MTKYMTYCTTWGVLAKITEVEIERETKSCVWIKGRRHAKITEYEIYHDTWELAHAHLVVRAEQHVERVRKSLEEHKSYLGNVKGMKKPQEAL